MSGAPEETRLDRPVYGTDVVCGAALAGAAPADLLAEGQEERQDLVAGRPGGRTPGEEIRSWRLWVVPLSAGIFAGAAAFEVLPYAWARTGTVTALWAVAGLAAFVGIHKGLDALGHQGASWASTLGMWLHSFLEGVVTATGYGVSVAIGVLLSVGLVAHLVPEATALVALLRREGLSVRQALIRTVLSWGLVLAGFLVVRDFLPLLSPPVLGAGMAFGAGGLAYLALVSWTSREGGGAGSAAALAAGLTLMGLVRFA
jgi:zinc transporter ZupT